MCIVKNPFLICGLLFYSLNDGRPFLNVSENVSCVRTSHFVFERTLISSVFTFFFYFFSFFLEKLPIDAPAMLEYRPEINIEQYLCCTFFLTPRWTQGFFVSTHTKFILKLSIVTYTCNFSDLGDGQEDHKFMSSVGNLARPCL